MRAGCPSHSQRSGQWKKEQGVAPGSHLGTLSSTPGFLKQVMGKLKYTQVRVGVLERHILPRLFFHSLTP